MTSPAERLAKDLGRKKEPPPKFTKLLNHRVSLRLEGSEVADVTGVSQSQISRLERGLCTCSVKTALKLAKFYGTTVEALFSEET